MISRTLIPALSFIALSLSPVHAESPLSNSRLRMVTPENQATEGADVQTAREGLAAAVERSRKLLPNNGAALPGLNPPKPQEITSETTEEEALQILIRNRRENQKFYEDMHARLETVPATSVFMEKLKDTFRGAVSGIPDPSLPVSAQAIIHHPNRSWVLYEGLVLGLIIFLVRRWRLKVAKSTWGKVWVQLWTTAALLICQAVVVPWLVFGDIYFDLFRDVSQVFQLASGR